MGASLSDISEVVVTLGHLASVELENVIDLKEGVYWIVLTCVNCLSLLMLILYIFNVFMIRGAFPKSGLMANLKSLSDTILPIIGNILFLPIISISLEVFICTETSGDDLADSFLHKDCYQTCWVDEHLTYAIISSLCLVVYLPVAVYMRPKWQEYQHDLHIITLPRSLIIKSIF
jgi:hypothetical protein